MPSSIWGGNPGDGKEGKVIIALVVLAVIILAAWYFFLRATPCTTNANCKTGQFCGSAGKCVKPGTGSTGTACTTDTNCATGPCASGKCGFRSGGRGRSGFNSDEVNWDGAGNLVYADTFPMGNYSGYGVTGFGTSYDTLYG